MLYLDSPIGLIKGLVIYRDHQDQSLFYYVSERPRLARNDGVPEFVYLKYKRDITDNPNFDPETKESLGGGFLAFTVDLGVDEDQLNEVKQELSKFADGDVKLAPVQFRKGAVRLSISKDAADAPNAAADEPKGFKFFEEVYGTTKPSLIGDNRATFSVVLGQEAATLFEEALKAGISPIGVIYDLEYLGLRPAFNVKITAEYKRIYDHLEISLAARGQIQVVSLAAEIDIAFQKLRDDGAVKVEVINFTDDADIKKQADEAFNWFKTELLKDFFKTALQPPSFMTPSSGGGLLGQLQGFLGQLGQPQTGSPQPVMGAPTTQPSNAAPGATTMQEGAQSTFSGASPGGSAPGGGTNRGGANALSPFQVGFSLKYYHQEELKTRTFEYAMQAAVARQAAPQGLFSTIVEGLNLDRAIKEINLDDDFFKRLVATISIGGDLNASGINAIAVNLEYPDKRKPNQDPMHVDGVVFRPDNLTPKTFTTWLNDKKSLDYRYQLDIHFKPDAPWVGKEAHHQSDWISTRSRQLTIDPLSEIGLFDLEIAFGELDSGQISQAQVELIYDDAANDFKTVKTFILKTGEASKHWKLRLSDPNLRTYQYRVTYFLQDNLQVTTDWQTSQDPVLVVNEPFRGKLNTRFVPLLDSNNLLEAVVDLTYHEPKTGYTRRFRELFSPDTPDTMKRRSLDIPTLAENPANYTYEITVVRLDGSVYQSDPIVTDNPVVLISDGAGTTHRIKVKLIGQDLTQAGLAAVKVDLVGVGEEGDRESTIFTPSQAAERIISLVQPDSGGMFTYTYNVTGYNLRGEVVPGVSAQTSDTTMFVKVPG